MITCFDEAFENARNTLFRLGQIRVGVLGRLRNQFSHYLRYFRWECLGDRNSCIFSVLLCQTLTQLLFYFSKYCLSLYICVKLLRESDWANGLSPSRSRYFLLLVFLWIGFPLHPHPGVGVGSCHMTRNIVACFFSSFPRKRSFSYTRL